MERKAELSINLIVIIVIALLILVVIVFIFGGRSGEFGRATQCISLGGQCVSSQFDCATTDYLRDAQGRNPCASNQYCCPATYVRR